MTENPHLQIIRHGQYLQWRKDHPNEPPPQWMTDLLPVYSPYTGQAEEAQRLLAEIQDLSRRRHAIRAKAARAAGRSFPDFSYECSWAYEQSFAHRWNSSSGAYAFPEREELQSWHRKHERQSCERRQRRATS